MNVFVTKLLSLMSKNEEQTKTIALLLSKMILMCSNCNINPEANSHVVAFTFIQYEIEALMKPLKHVSVGNNG